MWEVVARRCSAKKVSQKFLKIYREITVRQSLSNTVKSLQAVSPAVKPVTLLQKDSLVFQSYPFVDPLENECSWITQKIHKKVTVFESLFKCLEAAFHRCSSK